VPKRALVEYCGFDPLSLAELAARIVRVPV
jgi:hypothetical protein